MQVYQEAPGVEHIPVVQIDLSVPLKVPGETFSHHHKTLTLYCSQNGFTSLPSYWKSWYSHEDTVMVQVKNMYYFYFFSLVSFLTYICLLICKIYINMTL